MLYVYIFEYLDLPSPEIERVLDAQDEETLRRVKKYIKLEDRFNKYLSMAIAKKVFADFGVEYPKEFRRTAFGKPICDELFFNLSHTQGCVVFGASKDTDLGVDVERMCDISIVEYRDYLGQDVFDAIIKSKECKYEFYRYWVMLESALKADGSGISAFTASKIVDNGVLVNGVLYHPFFFDISGEHACAISTKKELNHNSVLTRRLDFSELA